jgi:hypothetical protein
MHKLFFHPAIFIHITDYHGEKIVSAKIMFPPSKYSKCITRNSNSNIDLWNLISSFRIEEKEDGDNDGLGHKGLESLENLKV